MSVALGSLGLGASGLTFRASPRTTVVTPTAFGAVGDGKADDTLALQAAFAELARHPDSQLWFSPGTYRITAPLQQAFPDEARIVIYGQHARIDAREIAGARPGETAMVQIGGARLDRTGLENQVQKNEDTLSARLGEGGPKWGRGSVILLTSTELFNQTRPYYYKGEICRVKAIEESKIELASGVFDHYEPSLTSVFHLAMPYVEVHDLQIEADANQIGLAIEYAQGVVVSGCRVRGARYTGIYLNYIQGGVVTSCEIADAWHIGTGTSYGIKVGSCQDVTVTGCNIREARHCLSAGGQEPARNIVFQNNHCLKHKSETKLVSIDSHENVELITIKDNTCNGISVGARSAEILDNSVFGESESGGAINAYYSDRTDYLLIRGNKVHCKGANTIGVWITGERGLLNSPTEVTIDRVIIDANEVRSTASSLQIEPRNGSSTNISINDIVVTNNTFLSQRACGFVVSGAAPMSFGTISISGNSITSVNYDSILIRDGTEINLTTISQNVIEGNRSNGYLISLSGIDVVITGNDISGNVRGGGLSRSIYYSNSGQITSSGNTITGVRYDAELVRARRYRSGNPRPGARAILNTAGAEIAE